MSTYTETMRRWAADTRRTGALDRADGTGEVGLESGEAGKRLAVRFSLRVRENRVEEIRYQVFGCGFTMAACAAAAELAEGRSLEDAGAVTTEQVDAVLEGLPAERAYCAELALEALHAAVDAAQQRTGEVRSVVHRPDEQEHGPRVRADDPLYQALMESPCPPGIAGEDRHLFACLLAVASQEPFGTAHSLGLSGTALATLVETYFPGMAQVVSSSAPASSRRPPEPNPDVRAILISHVPRDKGRRTIPASLWLARIIAARAAHPGHLWTAMGLFERPELTAAIRRHLPSLAQANSRGMRWKRFLYKQVCDLGGSVMCQAPDCGVCSDYPLCFGPE